MPLLDLGVGVRRQETVHVRRVPRPHDELVDREARLDAVTQAAGRHDGGGQLGHGTSMHDGRADRVRPKGHAARHAVDRRPGKE